MPDPEGPLGLTPRGAVGTHTHGNLAIGRVGRGKRSDKGKGMVKEYFIAFFLCDCFATAYFITILTANVFLWHNWSLFVEIRNTVNTYIAIVINNRKMRGNLRMEMDKGEIRTNVKVRKRERLRRLCKSLASPLEGIVRWSNRQVSRERCC
jgi:hypothetical protein